VHVAAVHIEARDAVRGRQVGEIEHWYFAGIGQYLMRLFALPLLVNETPTVPDPENA
jgi:hypothetical protein